MPAEELLTIKQVAEELQVHPRTVWNKVRAGELPSVRTSGDRGAYRIRRSDLERYLFGSGSDPVLEPPEDKDKEQQLIRLLREIVAGDREE